MAATIQTIQKPTKARALDTSGNNNHGQIYSGRALEFDGVTDYFTFDDFGSTLVADQALTIAFWFSTTSTSNATLNCFFSLHALTTSNRLRLGIDGNGGSTYILSNADTNYDIGTINYNDGGWYRGVIVIPAGAGAQTCTGYVNGISVGTASIDFDFSAVTKATIGMEWDGGPTATDHYDGKLSDFQIWDTAWTADDTLYDYQNPEQLALNRGGTSLTNSNLKLWYPMNDGHRGQQSFVLDASNTGLGDELLTNGDFSDNSVTTTSAGGNLAGWTSAGTNDSDHYWEITDGQCRLVTTDGTSTSMTQSILTSGVTYKYSFTINTSVDGRIKLQHGSTQIVITDAGATGTFTGYFTATHVSFKVVRGDDAGVNDVTFDDISIKSVNDKNHATTVFYGDEIAVNGDCEVTDPTTVAIGSVVGAVGDATFNDSTTVAHAGSKSLKVTGDSSSTYPKITWADGSDMGLVKGRTYYVELWAYIPSGNSLIDTAQLKVNSNGSSSVLVNSQTTATDTWTKLSGTFVDDDIANIQFIGYDASGSAGGAQDFSSEIFYMDDLSIKEVGTASGWTDADQQLDIPQTALQSYNQLAWFENDLQGASITNYVVASDNAALDVGTGDFSVSCWFYKYTIGTSGDSDYIFRKGGAGDEGYAGRVTGLGKISCNLDTDAGSNQWVDSAANVIEAGKWYHVVFSWDRSDKVYCYLNGEEITSGDFPDTITGNSDTLDNGHGFYIGANSTSAGGFRGTVTEVALFKNRAIGIETAKTLYNDGKALDAMSIDQATYITGYWRNNGLATWSDLSTNSNDASVGNITETMLITAGVDGSRDSQGFLMNRQRTTNSLNLEDDMADGIANTGSYMAALQSPFTADTDYNAMTLTLWFKTPNNTIRDSLFSIIYDNNTHFTVDTLDTGKFVWTYEGSTAVTDARYKTDADLYSSDKWTFVAFALDHDIGADANRVKCYVGDEDTAVSLRTADTTHATTTTSPSKDNSMQVGISYVNTNNFTGQVDDVCVYTKTLDLPEITRNYKAGKRSHR